jgi:short-subunit dehydrogenase
MTYWKDKVAIVTGGSAGLGFGIAKALIERDATVALVARDERRLQQARDQLGERVRIFPTDITVQAQVNQLQENVFEELGHVDALINCAGKSARGEILKTTPEDFQQLFEVNFLGLVRCTRAFMPSLIESKGHLVNIGSLAAKSASRYLGAYPATKFPVAAYSQQLRLELSSEGVHVLLACPGPIARADAGVRYDDSAVPNSAKRPGGGVMLKGLDPNKLVNRILLACEKRQLELIVPGKVKLLFAISQISPRLGDWLIMRMTS